MGLFPFCYSRTVREVASRKYQGLVPEEYEENSCVDE